MAVEVINLSDTFDEWRQKNNSVAVDVGDLTSLSTDDKTNLVSAINEVVSDATGFSVAMAIALG